jgi:hypothetical protein
MRQRPKAVHIPRVCGRCHLRLTGAQVRNGWVQLRDGFVDSTVCLSCTTVEELADLTILEATMECGYNVRDGRVLVRTKRFPD